VDEEAFSAIYEATAKPLWRYVARVSGRQDVADDTLQETFLRFLRSERTGLAPPEARRYLFRIATNLLHDRWRRGEDIPDPGTDVATTVDAPEAVLDTARMLHRLKPRARELLWLAYVEGMTHREIAQVTRLNVMSVRVLLSRAKREAAILLEPKGKSDAR
jgi:RNA polymerase sigma-70 factor (ECF subfamily)